MKEHEIAAVVRQMSGADDTEHAEAATRATLAVLADALPESGQGATFGVEEFYRRVADEEGRGCTPDGAREHARAVAAALKNGLDPAEYDELVSRLPNDYREDLLSTAPSGEHH